MTIEEIKKFVETDPSYKFLDTNPHLGERIIMLTLGGSYSYGTNNENSDVDIRGVVLEKPSDLIGLTRFEQVVDEATDTTIYGFNKICHLLTNCNPNTVEMLGCKSEHYIYLHPMGQMLLDNRKLFISQRCINSFGGYATQQLRRLENNLSKHRLSQALKEKHIRQSMEGAVKHFKERYTSFEYGTIKLYEAESPRDDLDVEVVMDVNMQAFPARQFNSMINDLKNVLDNYEKLTNRNKKKDDAHLNKHAMHLVRLYISCLDILKTGDIHTYPEEHIPFLLDIRNGKFMKEDGTYQEEFFDLINSYEKELDYAKDNTSIPEEPDMKRIEEFIMDVNKEVVHELDL